MTPHEHQNTGRIPAWIGAVAAIVFVLWVIFNVAYRFGAGGVSVGGASAEFDRKYDSALYEVDAAAGIGFEIDDHGVALTNYEPGLIPWRPVCGLHERAGRALPGFAYREGRWIYTEFPEMPGPDVYDLETGELHTFDPPQPKQGAVDLMTIAFYAEHRLLADEAHRVDPAWVAATYPGISLINESCFTLNAAFFLVFGVLAILAIVFVGLSFLRRRPG